MASGRGTSDEMKRKRSKGRTSGAKAESVCAPLSTTGARVEVEHGYEPTDRLLRTLLLAVCRSMNLEAYEDATRSPTLLFVTAPSERSAPPAVPTASALRSTGSPWRMP